MVGRRTFQPSDISWSYRNRGTVHRTHMNRKRKNRIFARKITIDSSESQPLYGPTLSWPVNGTSQPPKNSVAISALDVTMLAYSAMKKRENFIALYSVWYPAISSDSASGRSKGNRLVSANAATMNTKNATVRLMTFQPPHTC